MDTRLSTSRFSHVRSKSLLWGGLALAGVLPFLVAVYPPSLDYSYWLLEGHLVRQSLSSGGLPEFYDVRRAPIPNLASSLGIGALNLILSPLSAGRVFAVLCALGFAASFAVLTRAAQGWPTAIEFLGLPWAFGYFMYMGFLSYLASIALALVGVALVSRLSREGRAPGAWQLVGLAAIGVLAYLSHLFGWVVFVIAVGVHAVFALRLEHERLAVRLVISLLPSVALLGWHALGSGDPSDTRFYGSLLSKSYSLVNPLTLFLRIDPFPEIAPVFWLNLLALGAAGLIVYWNLRSGLVRSRAVPILFTGLICLALAVVLPFSWLAGLLRPDERLLLPGFLLVLASLPLKPYTRGRGIAAVSLAIAIMLVHTVEYRQASAHLADANEALTAHVPPGNRLLAASVHTGNLVRNACHPKQFGPSMGIPALQSVALYRSIETGDLRANIFGTGLVRPRVGSESDADVIIRVYTQEMIEARADLGSEIRSDYPFVAVSGCETDRQLMIQALAPEYAPVASGEGFVILRRVD